MIRTIRVFTGIAVTTTLAVSVSLPSFAQNSPALEEIIVTAQRRSENLQDVPIAITAFSSEALEKGGFNDVGEISQAVPGMSIATHFQYANPKIYLRGVGNNEYQANAVGAVAVYQDDVYLAAASGQLFQFYDLESVEILRGPQGTLYGKNTTGGAIKVTSRRPGDELEGNINISAGNFNALDIEGGVSFPMIEDTLAARIAVVSNSRDGFVKNTYVDPANTGRNNEDVNGRDSSAARLLLAYTPSENLSIDFNVHTGENRSTAMQGESFFLADLDNDPNTPLQVAGFFRDFLPAAFGITTGQGTENPDKFVQAYNYDISESLDANGGNVKVIYDFDNISLTSITATESVSRNSREDVDQTPASILQIEWDNESEQFTQEFQLANSDNGDFNWITGLYYFDDEIKVNNIYDLGRDLQPLNATLAFFINELGITNQDYVQNTDAFGAFAQGTYALTPDLNFTLGVRYTDETREWSGNSRRTPLDGTGTVVLIPQQTLEDDWQSTSWRVALDYSFNDDMLGYFSVNRGHKAGGFNGGSVADVSELNPAFDQEVLTAYEVGLKSDLVDGRVRLNLASFFYDYKDIQIFTIEPPVPGDLLPLQVIRNAESAESYGIEVELLASITDNLLFSLNGGYLKTEIGNYAPRPDIDYTGNEIGNSPNYDINMGLDYIVPVANASEWVFHIDVTAKDDHWFDPSNSDRVFQEGYEIWNAYFAYVHDSGRWSATLWTKNLLDEEYTTEIIPIDGFFFDEHFAGLPRTYGLRLNFAFN